MNLKMEMQVKKITLQQMPVTSGKNSDSDKIPKLQCCNMTEICFLLTPFLNVEGKAE
jgi:hypothetical protein